MDLGFNVIMPVTSLLLQWWNFGFYFFGVYVTTYGIFAFVSVAALLCIIIRTLGVAIKFKDV